MGEKVKTVDFSETIAASDLKVGRWVVVLGFYVSPTAKVIRRRDLGLKSHP